MRRLHAVGMRTATLTALATCALAVGAPATSAGTGPPPLPPGSDFVRTIDNPWFPLPVGTVLTYHGEDEGVPASDVLRVTRKTRVIAGVRATVVDDRVYKRGRLAERTHDYYAQDRAGNVWYLGE